jgi:hypothetical protein
MEVRISVRMCMLHSLILTAEFRKYVGDEIYILNNLDASEFGSSAAVLELQKRYWSKKPPLFCYSSYVQ